MSGHFSHKLRGSGESVVSSVYIHSMYIHSTYYRSRQRVLQPEDVIAGNYDRIERFHRRQTHCVQAGHDAAACNDALGRASRFINACIRRHGAFRWKTRRGRTESVSGISLGSTDAPTARSWTSKMESNAPCDESG